MMKNKKQIITATILIIAVIVSTMVFSTSAIAKTKIKSKSVSLNTTAITLAVGDIATLDAAMKPTNSTDSLKWSSSNKNVATVTSSGVVTAKSEGTAKITVKTSSKKTASCKITVKNYLTKDETLDLIKSNTLSAETVKSIVESNTVSKDDIINLIKQNTLSEAYINSLIDAKVVSESRIKELIAQSTGGSLDFNDGDEVEHWSKQEFPFAGSGITVNNAVIKKYHCSEWTDSKGNILPQKIRYEITFEGKITRKVGSLEIIINYIPEGYGAIDERYYGFNLANSSSINGRKDGNIEHIYYSIDEDGNFVYKVNQYNMPENMEMFTISDAHVWYEE
jgi:hypothetical protein